MKKLALTVGLFVLLASSSAWAVPQYLTFSGRLKTSSGPVNGSVNLTFNLFSAATGGTAVWTEVRNGVGASQGLVFLDLGQVTTLDSSYFTGPRMYLEITVGTEVLSPRVAINSVPYAMHTENSDTLGGTIGPTDVITSAAGTTGVTATKTGNALAVSLNTAACSSGNAFKWNGSSFACAADADTAPTAGNGINVTTNTVSLSTTGCSTGYVWKYNGATFACAADADTAPTAGVGIAVASNTVSLITTGCVNGSVYKYSTATSNFACAADADSGGDIVGITTNAGSGLDGGCATGTCTLTVNPTDFNAIPTLAYQLQTLIDTDYTVGETVDSVSITVPTTGYVHVVLTGVAFCNTCAVGTTESLTGYFSISTNATGAINTGNYSVISLGPNDGGNANIPMVDQAIFPVTAGTYTFYLRAGRSGTTETYYAYRTRMVAAFIPD